MLGGQSIGRLVDRLQWIGCVRSTRAFSSYGRKVIRSFLFPV